MPLAACTIVAKNYLPFARVLARSFAEHHPEGRFFVLLIDRNDGYIAPETEDFTLVEVEELGNVPELDAFLMKYTILEASTAVKPYFLAYLFERYELETLVYFDPDILILDGLDELAARLEESSIVLTPHLTSPIDDDAHPGELAILQAGAYNLGFLALRRSAATERLLPWWQSRLYDQCVVRIDRGLFVDQKWMDLVPGMFGGGGAVHILDGTGYNVAYWNLHGREVAETGSGWRAGGDPLVFFHFSGIDPESLGRVSKYQDRFTLASLGAAAELYRRYRDLLFAAGYRECKSWPYAFGRFAGGAAIPDLARQLYHSLPPARRRAFGDPFAGEGEGSFFQWLNQPLRGGRRRPPYLSRLQGRLRASRPDLVKSFPDAEGSDFPAFSSWLLDYGRFEYKLDEAFLATLHRESRATLFTAGGFKRRVENRLKRLAATEAGLEVRRSAKRLLGRRRSQALRARLRPRPDHAPQVAARRLPAPSSLERLGINLVGYLQAETGMGEAARSLARAFATTGVPVSLHSLELNVLARRGDETFAAVRSDFPHDVNLFVVNADQVMPVWEHLGSDVFGGRYNVGFWLWELETFPDTLRGAFDVLHEIWTPSTFCADAISEISPLPVRRVPLPVVPTAGERFDRRHFGLPEDAFIFFFMFNFLSYFERKNPLAVVRAFRQAFSADDDALLLLKTSQSDFAPQAAEALRREIEGSNVRLIDEYLSRDEITSLTALADGYVSLHRSEGYGLTLAEAMFHGKPVIATPYSGNADFMNLGNGYPVDYRLVELAEDAGPYPAGGRWAEPSVEHAAERMREVYDHRERARAVGERARADVARELGLEPIGRLLERRFEEIVRQVHRDSLRLPHPT